MYEEELAHPKTLGIINERMLSKYARRLREKGYKSATLQGHLAYLRAALRWAADQKFIPVAPKVVMPKVSKKQIIRKIGVEEFERLLARAPDDCWAAFLQTAWYTGMGRNEMLDLTWDGEHGTPWVDFAEGRIWLPAASNKSDGDQWLPLQPDLAEILKLRRQAVPVERIAAGGLPEVHETGEARGIEDHPARPAWVLRQPLCRRRYCKG